MSRNRRLTGSVALAFGLVLASMLASRSATAQEPRGYELTVVDMKGKKEVLGTLPANATLPRGAPDGDLVAYALTQPGAEGAPPTLQLWVAEVEHLDKRHALAPDAPESRWAAVEAAGLKRPSPDGKWVVYTANEGSQPQIWVEPVPQTGKRFRVTPKGGHHPLWSPDGYKIYFEQGGQLFRIEMFLDSATPQAGDPEPLPIKGFKRDDAAREFDLISDGHQFLMLFPLK